MKYQFIYSLFKSKQKFQGDIFTTEEINTEIINSEKLILSLSALIYGILAFINIILKCLLEYRARSFFFLYISNAGIAIYLIMATLYLVY